MRILPENPRRARLIVMAACFAFGLLAGWLLSLCWLGRESGINL